MIEQLATIVEKTGCDTCKTSFNRVDLEGNFLWPETVTPGDFAGEQVQKELLPRMIGSAPDRRDSIPMSACCTMYSMDIIRGNNIRFVSERQWISEDIIFNIVYYAKAQRVILSDYIGYNYRINPRSLSTSYRQDRFEKSYDLYIEQIRILKELGIYEDCRYRLMRRFFLDVRLCVEQMVPKISRLHRKEAVKQIGIICADPRLQQIIKEYPVGKMGLKQQAFVYMLKYKLAALLYILH